MKRKGKSLFFALAIALMGLAFSCKMTPVPISVMPDISVKPDGTYTGFYDGGLVKAKVSVALAGGRIAGIKILSHDCSPIGKKAESIVGRVIEGQRLDVDVVSGATGSSMVLLKAMEIALTGVSGT